MTSPWRPEFEAALALLASVSDALVRQGHSRPILVGGAALELYSASAYTTGDFDLVAARQDAVESELQRNGFVRPSGPGKLTRGWVHPDLQLGFEIVGSNLLDGHADRTRMRLFGIGTAGDIAVIGIEDLIADRMGQFSSGAAPECLAQARQLRVLAPELDMAYLERRISEETSGEFGAAALDG
jgi:hypothetical protein